MDNFVVNLHKTNEKCALFVVPFLDQHNVVHWMKQRRMFTIKCWKRYDVSYTHACAWVGCSCASGKKSNGSWGVSWFVAIFIMYIISVLILFYCFIESRSRWSLSLSLFLSLFLFCSIFQIHFVLFLYFASNDLQNVHKTINATNTFVFESLFINNSVCSNIELEHKKRLTSI